MDLRWFESDRSFRDCWQGFHSWQCLSSQAMHHPTQLSWNCINPSRRKLGMSSVKHLGRWLSRCPSYRPTWNGLWGQTLYTLRGASTKASSAPRVKLVLKPLKPLRRVMICLRSMSSDDVHRIVTYIAAIIAGGFSFFYLPFHALGPWTYSSRYIDRRPTHLLVRDSRSLSFHS